MTSSGQTSTIHQFRRVVARRFGLHFDDDKLPFLEELLRRRVEAGKRTDDAYLAFLDSDVAASAGGGELVAELGRLAEELTVPETYFFRNNDQFRAFTERCLPERLRLRADARPGRPQLRLLSAGCASGEEAYSLAILLHEKAAGILPTWEVSIVGVDINPVVLAKAERARYSPWALRETDAATKARWFRMDGREAILAESARALVRFERRNLTDDDLNFWWPESTDVVFCRNVLMYLTPPAAQAVMARISRTLVPGGYLFLGHAETLRGLSHDFHLCHTHGTFYYQRKPGAPADVRAEAPAPGLAAEAPSGGAGHDLNLVSAVEGADSWIDAIRVASERIQALTERAPLSPERGDRASTAPAPAAAARPANIAPGLDLLRAERFADGIAFVRSLPPESASDPEAMLLHAVLLTHAARLDEAQALCLDLLRADDLNAGAHYVLALCREAAGDPSAAEEHDRAAAYLDGGFAMPRLHLGLLARRRGQLAAAQRELTAALSLLQREDPARILLFGGGFGREALMALCRAELTASEDHR
jgi:chemotaxis protein methyltransferase CheR